MKTIVKKISVKEIFDDKDFEELVNKYSGESKVSSQAVNIDFEKYIALEDSGMLDCFASYNEIDDMVGFLALVKNYSLHLSKFSVIIESYFVLNSYRKFGTGKILIGVAEEYARHIGAIAMLMPAPTDSRLSRVAVSFGYKNKYAVYMKEFNV
jgi:GNAT superfamily N-acetyltransferase